KDPVAAEQDLLIAAPIWHDWAKIIVFQWNADGSEFQELGLGGNGKTDKDGAPGLSKTGAHHVLGVAETMARGLPAKFVITQASAHSAPALGNEFRLINWLRTAAIIAQVDPVAKGYLVRDANGKYALPPGWRPEPALHYLSDANFFLTMPAMKE